MGDKATLYSPSVKDFRAGLVKAAAMYEGIAGEYEGAVFGRDGAPPAGPAARDAHMASTMAMNYAYTLAAVIRYAGDHFGEEVGWELANLADNILTNGDDDDLNGDVAEAPHG